MLTGLINNLQRITKTTKEAYFGTRWGSAAAFAKKIDRAGYEFDEMDQTSPTTQLNKQILGSLQLKPEVEVRHFVGLIREESLSFLAERRGVLISQMEQMALFNESMTLLIGRLFSKLESYSIELNSYVGCTELQTMCTQPDHVCEVTKFSRTRAPLETVTYYRARLATTTWSIVIRGKEDRIEIYLLPVGRVLGLTKSEMLYEPAAVLNGVLNGNRVEWEYEEKVLTDWRETEVAVDLFVQLIDKTKQQILLDAKS